MKMTKISLSKSKSKEAEEAAPTMRAQEESETKVGAQADVATQQKEEVLRQDSREEENEVVGEADDVVPDLPLIANSYSASDGTGSFSDEDPTDGEFSDMEYEGRVNDGLSDFGFNDNMHKLIMSIGSVVHKVVGDPVDPVEKKIHDVGDWLQEATEMVGEFRTGKSDFKQDTIESVGSIVSIVSVKKGNSEEDEKEVGVQPLA